ncbi:O-antigen ligase family protein [Larkinella insperata]|uniref:O-antigen ligase family protein n=1 Tax=Larkinella insperata TaxID=332158 RepID=A0ABW3QEM9_9BACT|nr:O-antigen ligase family protein [Larkinella insperata]
MKYTPYTEVLQYRGPNPFRTILNDILIISYLLLITNAFFAPVLFNYEQDEVENSFFFKILKYIILLIFITINKKPSLSISNLSLGNRLFFLISIFYCFSFIWSEAKLETLTSAIQFVFFVYFCYNISKNKNVDLIKILKYYVIFVLLASYLFYFFVPSLGRMTGFHHGLARGVFLHKNVLGTILTTILPVFLCNLKSVKNCIFVVITLSLIYLSGSSASLITSTVIFSLSLFIKKIGTKKLTILLIMLFTFSILLYNNYYDIFFKMLGKSEDLTGRVKLWENLSDAIYQKPFFGWGYWGFWKSSAKMNVFSDMDWVTGKAHNAFLDILLSGGLTLLVLSLVLLIYIFMNILKTDDKNIRAFGILTFISTFILCLTEISLLQHNSINLLILCWLMNYNNQIYKIQPGNTLNLENTINAI